ncbi:MAG TPA: aconitate hydratase AcnA [Myxococcota bacterium]|nr:aconitate hydratase AcnA [Myxococcota bacterium]HQK52002.1 aconitate hydratase AcnA [Myxococcota bacterium]
MNRGSRDPFGALARLPFGDGRLQYIRIEALDQGGRIARWPFSLKVILEALIRNCDGHDIREADVAAAASWDGVSPVEVPFLPARILLQDFTGVPVVADLAAVRSAVAGLGGDPARVEPLIPVDLVVDHSVQVDVFGTSGALAENMRLEFQRNVERYRFLKWGRQAFRGVRVVPPGVGIVHQVNLEHLARVVFRVPFGEGELIYPDTVLGTDSHTPMVNSLGVVGFGVGGIEAEAAMLGKPLSMLMPDVLGVRLLGALPPGTTATDLALTVTQVLRRKGVVGKFVEFFGPGLASLSVQDRSTVANMAPEYGATVSFFPWDRATLRYLASTGRPADHLALVEAYARSQGLFRDEETPDPSFRETIDFDLGAIEPSVAGPKRPQDRIPLPGVKKQFATALTTAVDQGGYGRPSATMPGDRTLGHGSVVLAAITSCTNTSNPSLLLAAGLVAKHAVERGLQVAPWVKTSLAPGSRVVTEYLRRTGLLPFLEALGFHVVGYGCTTCIGNSGPLPEPVREAVTRDDLVVAAVLSGNRNFEGRINPLTRANYLASPPLVVAYALAGTVNLDLTREPLGLDSAGRPVMLADLWPTAQELDALRSQVDDPQDYRLYRDPDSFHPDWAQLGGDEGYMYAWDPTSTYILEPPFLQGVSREPTPLASLRGARILAWLGDSITTDHISPAGSIPPDSPAGRYLMEHGVPPEEFNSYGARRGNHLVMARGTFAHPRLRNRLVPGREGGITRHLPSGEVMSIFDASARYLASDTPLVVVAGKEYGTGSSRDWAAKGPALLGVRAVLAESFERIHRANLVAMGVLPLQFLEGQTADTVGLRPEDVLDIDLSRLASPRQELEVVVRREDGDPRSFRVLARADTPAEVETLRQGGVLPAVLRRLLG